MQITKTFIAAACCAALLSSCATTGVDGPGINRVETGDGVRARIDYFTEADCTSRVGASNALPDPVSLFVVTVVANVVRGELIRRATAEQEKFTKTYGVRRNFEPAPVNNCIAVERQDAQGEVVMRAIFELVPSSARPGGRSEAFFIRPVYAQIDQSLARTRGADQKFNLTVTLSMTGVIAGDDGPEIASFFTQAFTFADLKAGVAATPLQLGEPSPYLPAMPGERPVTVAASVTEKGSGGDFYRDISSALAANEDALQALIDSRFGED